MTAGGSNTTTRNPGRRPATPAWTNSTRCAGSTTTSRPDSTGPSYPAKANEPSSHPTTPDTPDTANPLGTDPAPAVMLGSRRRLDEAQGAERLALPTDRQPPPSRMVEAVEVLGRGLGRRPLTATGSDDAAAHDALGQLDHRSRISSPSRDRPRCAVRVLRARRRSVRRRRGVEIDADAVGIADSGVPLAPRRVERREVGACAEGR